MDIVIHCNIISVAVNGSHEINKSMSMRQKLSILVKNMYKILLIFLFPINCAQQNFYG